LLILILLFLQTKASYEDLVPEEKNAQPETVAQQMHAGFASLHQKVKLRRLRITAGTACEWRDPLVDNFKRLLHEERAPRQKEKRNKQINSNSQ
jgi:hypothetical protein